MGKRKDPPPSRAAHHRIDYVHLILYIDRTAYRTVVKRINVPLKATTDHSFAFVLLSWASSHHTTVTVTSSLHRLE